MSPLERFLKKVPEMKPLLLKGVYPEQIIDCKVKNLNFRENRKKIERNRDKEVPFVAIYHPELKGLSKIIKCYLYM